MISSNEAAAISRKADLSRALRSVPTWDVVACERLIRKAAERGDRHAYRDIDPDRKTGDGRPIVPALKNLLRFLGYAVGDDPPDADGMVRLWIEWN